MEAEEEVLKLLRNSDAAKLIAHASVKAGRDPYRDLGLPDAPLTVSTARLIFDLTTVKEEGEVSETDLDAATLELQAEMDARDAWAAATDPDQDENPDGYQGARGVTPEGAVRRLARPLTSRARRLRDRTPLPLSSWIDITVPGPYALTVEDLAGAAL